MTLRATRSESQTLFFSTGLQQTGRKTGSITKITAENTIAYILDLHQSTPGVWWNEEEIEF